MGQRTFVARHTRAYDVAPRWIWVTMFAMPQHFEIRPTEKPGCTIDLLLSYYRLHKVIVEVNDSPKQEDSLDLLGTILSPDELWGHRIEVELRKKEEPQISVVEDYKGIGKLFFMQDSQDSHIECGSIARGYFAVCIDVDLVIFNDLANLLVSLEGKRSIARELYLNVIGLLNHWDLEGDLPLLSFHMIVKSRRKSPQKRQDTLSPPVELIPPLVFHGDD